MYARSCNFDEVLYMMYILGAEIFFFFFRSKAKTLLNLVYLISWRICCHRKINLVYNIQILSFTFIPEFVYKNEFFLQKPRPKNAHFKHTSQLFSTPN